MRASSFSILHVVRHQLVMRCISLRVASLGTFAPRLRPAQHRELSRHSATRTSMCERPSVPRWLWWGGVADAQRRTEGAKIGGKFCARRRQVRSQLAAPRHEPWGRARLLLLLFNHDGGCGRKFRPSVFVSK